MAGGADWGAGATAAEKTTAHARRLSNRMLMSELPISVKFLPDLDSTL